MSLQFSKAWQVIWSSAVTAGVVVLVDQFTKTWLAPHLGWAVTLNTAGVGSVPWLGTHVTAWLWGGGAVLIGLSLWAIHQLHQSSHQWPAWGLILGGGASNWLDRWQWQGVRDWLSVPGLELKNNVADYALTVGIFCLVVNWMQSARSTESL